MHHIAFELRDFAHLQSACDLFGEKDIPIAGVRRGSLGHNVATFTRDAHDCVTEFYAELDQIKDEALGSSDPRPWHQDHPQRPRCGRAGRILYVWGPPPTPDFRRARERRSRTTLRLPLGGGLRLVLLTSTTLPHFASISRASSGVSAEVGGQPSFHGTAAPPR